MLQKYYKLVTDKLSKHRLHKYFKDIRWFTTVIILLMVFIPIAELAQNRISSKAPSDAEILFLGTAGGPPLRYERSEPSTLLIVDGRQYLIDCGIGTIRRMVQAGIQSEKIRTIFITHHHPDHDLGLADIMANDYFWLNMAGGAYSISIYGPPQTEEFVNAAFNYISIPFSVFTSEPNSAFAMGNKNNKVQNPFVAHDVLPGNVFYQDDKIRVIAVENSHYALMPLQFRTQAKSYSFRFETPYGVIVFTGDTGPSDAVEQLAKGADVLVSEVLDLNAAAKFVQTMAKRNNWPPERSKALMEHMKAEHLSMKEVGQLASKAQVKSVLLYHYTPTNPAAYVAEVKKYFSGQVFAPSDLDKYCLSPKAWHGTSSNSILTLCQKHTMVH